MDVNLHEQEAKIFKVLMHPVRLAILEVLREGEECVCHMEACLGYRQAYISQQLAVLREAGFIQDRRDGWNIFYRVTQPEIFAVIDSASILSKGAKQDGTLAAGLKAQPVACPCPRCSGQESSENKKEQNPVFEGERA